MGERTERIKWKIRKKLCAAEFCTEQVVQTNEKKKCPAECHIPVPRTTTYHPFHSDPRSDEYHNSFRHTQGWSKLQPETVTITSGKWHHILLRGRWHNNILIARLVQLDFAPHFSKRKKWCPLNSDSLRISKGQDFDWPVIDWPFVPSPCTLVAVARVIINFGCLHATWVRLNKKSEGTKQRQAKNCDAMYPPLLSTHRATTIFTNMYYIGNCHQFIIIISSVVVTDVDSFFQYRHSHIPYMIWKRLLSGVLWDSQNKPSSKKKH